MRTRTSRRWTGGGNEGNDSNKRNLKQLVPNLAPERRGWLNMMLRLLQRRYPRNEIHLMRLPPMCPLDHFKAHKQRNH